MSSRKLSDLSKEMAACCAEFEAMLNGRGFNFVRTCTYRSAAEQNDLYAQGRTAPGRIVTHARGFESPHNDIVWINSSEVKSITDYTPASNAADYYPLMQGKLLGDVTNWQLAIWEEFGQIGEACGMEWGGRWPMPKKDRPHFQLKGWVKREYINSGNISGGS
jgi:peptidoglycan L-alanyl-D-glutamate endopeptidase CwlK